MKSFIEYCSENVIIDPYSKTYKPLKLILNKKSDKEIFEKIDAFLSNFVKNNVKISNLIYEVSDISLNKPIIMSFKVDNNDANNVNSMKIISEPLKKGKFITFKVEGSDYLLNKIQKSVLNYMIDSLETDFNRLLKEEGF